MTFHERRAVRALEQIYLVSKKIKCKLLAVGVAERHKKVFARSDSYYWFYQWTTFRSYLAVSIQEDTMLSDVDLHRAAHLMMHEYGHDAELEAARRADQMLARGDRDELVIWFGIRQTIAEMRGQTPPIRPPN